MVKEFLQKVASHVLLLWRIERFLSLHDGLGSGMISVAAYTAADAIVDFFRRCDF